MPLSAGKRGRGEESKMEKDKKRSLLSEMES